MYTMNPKKHEYSDETKAQAINMHLSGISGRGIGQAMGMSKANVYNWIKKDKQNKAGNCEKEIKDNRR